MTRSEYIQRAEEARELDIKERWTPRTKKFNPDVPYCKICDVDTIASPAKGCEACPLYSSVGHCFLYKQWNHTKIRKARFAAAQVMINFLRAWDIPAWADMLVEQGILERD